MRASWIAAFCLLLGLAVAAWAADVGVRPDTFVGLPWNWTATQTFDLTHTITGLPSPSGSSDVATMGYVDGHVGGGGTVTSITCNGGLTGGAITTSGTCALDATNANTWSGIQQFNSGDFKLKGASSGTIIVNAAAAAGSNTLTLPAGTTDFSATGGTSQVLEQTSSGGAFTVARLACSDLSNSTTACSTAIGTSGAVLPLLNGGNTWSGVQSVNDGDLALKGSSSGTTTLKASAAAGTTTITFPAATDTVAVLATAQTWTATQSSTPQTLVISTATFTPAAASGNNIKITLVHASCPCTIANPSGTPVAGTSGVLEIIQSSSGSDTIGTWGSQFMATGGVASLTLSTGANAKDFFSYYVEDSTHILVTTAALNATH